jgi:hypothetical protein
MASTLVNRSKTKGPSEQNQLDRSESKDQKGYWLSKNPSKRWGEIFFIYYSVFWIGIFGGVVVLESYKVRIFKSN